MSGEDANVGVMRSEKLFYRCCLHDIYIYIYIHTQIHCLSSDGVMIWLANERQGFLFMSLSKCSCSC